ncbi:Erg28 like protein-domain-containing protein [Absidia repens]|uniref:Erg28 like protein-domain-containing protein n=1 Tax=Absidia repens TaxID=90262 RepID=A0A1X2I947_9FUNG|nr:Erg28 like protein-domain-containing protein [Absidia repens]
MDFIVGPVTDIFSTLPVGYLPKWLLFTSALGIFNSIQNFCTMSLTKRVYSGHPEQVTPLSARLFATWTWSVSMIRIYAAFHLQHRFMYDLGLWTYVIALTHYAGEVFVFGGCKLNGPVLSPFCVAVTSLIWMIQVKDEYVKFI